MIDSIAPIEVLHPTSPEQAAAAARLVARHSRDREDQALLLEALALPDPPTTPSQIGPPMTDAFTAVAVSMYRNGDTFEAINQATGLSQEDLAAAVQAAAPTGRQEQADTTLGGTTEDLLAWGEQHTAKGIRALAARARAALADLAQRRQTEHAVTRAEAEVIRLRDELARAEQAVKQAKTGTTGTVAPAAPAVLTPGKGERDEIRAWARASGLKVSDRGLIAKHVLDAWAARDTAPAADLAQAG